MVCMYVCMYVCVYYVYYVFVVCMYGMYVCMYVCSRRNRVNHLGGSFYLKFAHLLSNF